MASFRRPRAEGELKREIGRILAEEVRDPAADGIYVTQVELSRDKKSARVLIAGLDAGGPSGASDDPARALQRAAGFIQRSLASRVPMRGVPHLRFEYDRSGQAAERMDTLFQRIRKRSRKSGPAVILLCALTASGRAEQALQRFESAADAMGSEFRIACYAPETALAANAVTAAFDEARRIDAFLSNYKPDSELSRINREAGGRAVAISPEMTDLLAACLRYHRISEGAFDITVGALVETWGFFRGNGKMPGRPALWLARRKVGSQHVQLDRANRTVKFLRSGLRLDPGGIGKGYAVDRAVAVLREYGIERALVSAGASSIYALGSPPGNARGWTVSIRDPSGSSDSVGKVLLKDRSLSSSGSDEKFFEVGGKRYAHILDPRSGRPAEGMRSVSVITPKTIDSEAWATTIFVNGADWAGQNRPPDARFFLCPSDAACFGLD